MAEYARVEGETVIERRIIEAMPPHKAHLWRPVVYEGSGPLSDIVIEAERVRVVRRELALDGVKAAALQKIDADAEAVRQKYLTAGAGMALTYQEKLAQARAVLALGAGAADALTVEQREAQFPTLAASVGLEAETLFGCAELVEQSYAQFATLSLQIERTRIAGKKAVREAADAAGVAAAYAAVAWGV